MVSMFRRSFLPLVLSLVAGNAAHAQYYKQLYSLKGGSISASYMGQFSTPLTTDTSSTSANIGSTGGGVTNQTVTNQGQFTTDTGGLLVSVQLHPVPFAGVEVNYGYFRSEEIYQFNYSSTTTSQKLVVPVTANEATAAYVFHPKHILFQPFVNVGGGAISFIPQLASNQWRATGLVEAGVDLPTRTKHLAIRIEGRSLVYRAPNFNQSAISTRSWRVTDEPVAGIVYRF